jgi:hypothetical protein
MITLAVKQNQIVNPNIDRTTQPSKERFATATTLNSQLLSLKLTLIFQKLQESISTCHSIHGQAVISNGGIKDKPHKL